MALRIRVPALSVATADVTVGGQTLTVTPTLIVGAVNISVTINGQTITVTPVLVDGAVVITNPDVTVAGQTLTVTPVLIAGDVTVPRLTGKPPGGDDAPRSHVGIPPKLVKDKKRRKQIERDELEALYNRILGIEPQTKVEKKAMAAVKRAVAPQAAELPPTLDWEDIDNDLKAAIAIRRAWKVMQDDEEDAVIALLLAA